jgi:ribosomal protein S16
MAKKKRLSPNQLAKLKRDFAGLKTITTYNPVKEEFKTEKVEIVDSRINNLLSLEAQKLAEIADIRSQLAETGTDYSQVMKGVRQQVVAQFSDDSPEYEAVGGIRVSDRKSGLHRGDGSDDVTPKG